MLIMSQLGACAVVTANCTLAAQEVTEPDAHQQCTVRGQRPQAEAGEIPLNVTGEMFQNESRHALEWVPKEVCNIYTHGDFQHLTTKP